MKDIILICGGIILGFVITTVILYITEIRNEKNQYRG